MSKVIGNSQAFGGHLYLSIKKLYFQCFVRPMRPNNGGLFCKISNHKYWQEFGNSSFSLRGCAMNFGSPLCASILEMIEQIVNMQETEHLI